jgi:glycosyltransferase involved in cell wall biosynthesis
VDTDQFAPAAAPTAADTVTIGWSGSPSTIAHLRPLLPVLERVKAAYGTRVRLRVMGDPSFSHAPLELQGEAWSSSAEMRLLREIDIGVMPLPDDKWTRGKCGIKGLVSMSMGAATVMSPVGVNVQIVRHGGNGYLAASDDEWFEALSLLIEDHGLRRRIGLAGRQTVEDHYSVRRWEGTLADVLVRAAA